MLLIKFVIKVRYQPNQN
ncbi:erythromycin resistance leader peptide [Staphylococcus aureus]